MCTQPFANRCEQALPSPQAASTLFLWHKQDAVPVQHLALQQLSSPRCEHGNSRGSTTSDPGIVRTGLNAWVPAPHHCQTCLRTPLPNTLALIKSSSLHPSLALSSSLLLSNQSQVQDTANTAYTGANPARTPTWLHQSQLWSPSQERRSGHVSLFCQSWQCWEPYFWVVIISLYVFTLHSLQASVTEFLHLYIYIF